MVKIYVELILIDCICVDYFLFCMDMVMIIVFGVLVLWVIYNFVSWGIVNVVWFVENCDFCVYGFGGVCWGVIDSCWCLIFFGFYLYEE